MKRNMKLLISLLLLVTVMPSCIYDEEPQDIDITDGIRMGFTICTAGDTSTRGQTANTPPETGSDLENRIDIENRDFRVYFYQINAENTYIGELEVMMVNQDPENSGNYRVVGKIAGESIESLSSDFRIVVMANLAKWGDYPQKPTSGTDSQEYLYNDNGYCVSEDKLIPMWGCRTYTDVKFQEGVVTQLEEPIDMLRAFAKIEVINETQDTNLQLTEVSLTGHHTRFYIQPAASGYTNGNTNADFTDCNVPENGTNTDTALKFTEDSESMNKNKFILYVPEYTTTGTSTPMKLTVSFNNGVVRNIDLSGEDSKITTLLRNHIYRFKVSLKKGTLSIYYQGIPWEKKDEIKIESGCDYDYNSSTNN